MRKVNRLKFVTGLAPEEVAKRLKLDVGIVDGLGSQEWMSCKFKILPFKEKELTIVSYDSVDRINGFTHIEPNDREDFSDEELQVIISRMIESKIFPIILIKLSNNSEENIINIIDPAKECWSPVHKDIPIENYELELSLSLKNQFNITK